MIVSSTPCIEVQGPSPQPSISSLPPMVGILRNGELAPTGVWSYSWKVVMYSAAAPTAGLHFTDELLDRIRAKGVDTAFLTLHVGLGTFRPVKEDDLTKHVMHSEWYELPADAAEKINAAKKRGGRVVSVGTTSCRTLETVAGKLGCIKADSGETDIFIYPGYEFKCVDALITNFHLPESTLIMLVSAFSSREIILNAYKQAVEKKYRFFSFGDAMFLY